MMPPVAQMRASLPFSAPSLPHSPIYTQSKINISEDPFKSYEATQPPASSIGTLTKAKEEICDEARRSYFEKEGVDREYSIILKATSHLRETDLAGLTAKLNSTLVQVLK